MAVTARVWLSQNVISGEGDDQQANLTFYADYQDGRNAEWAKYTPALSLTMTVKAEAMSHFEVGEKYTLTFTKTSEEAKPE